MEFDVKNIRNKTLVKYPYFGTITTNVTFHVDDNIPEPSIEDVTVTKNGNTVLITSGVQITIKNSSGVVTNKITSTAPDTFTISYKITYEIYTKTLNRTIIVKEKEKEEQKEETNP